MTIKNLKIIALVTMTLDHIAKFIPNSPIIFRFLGRLSAPLFFFCCAWSIDLTNNKKYYILRLYLFSILMSIINYISMKFIIPNNGYNLNNNIFRTLFLLSIIIYIYDRTLKDRKKRILYIAAFLSWQIINCTIIALLITNHILDSNFVLPILFSVLGLCIDIEGGFFIILGFGCYIYKKEKKKLFLFLLSFFIIYLVISKLNVMPRIIIFFTSNGLDFFSTMFFILTYSILGLEPFMQNTNFEYFIFQNYQWMMIFSLPFIMNFDFRSLDTKPSKLSKYFYYIYYPVHLFVLYLISNFI